MKVTIEIEDAANGTVKITSHPSYGEIQKMMSRNEVTMVHMYTVKMMKAALEVSKEMNERFGENDPSKIWLPPS